jgi:hypothetical protein
MQSSSILKLLKMLQGDLFKRLSRDEP